MLLAPPLCWSCRGPAGRGRALCAGCRSRLRFLSREPFMLLGVRVWAAVAYEGPARDLVRGLKFRGALGLAETLSSFMASATLLESATELVPVPLHPRRRRRRGFNQAGEIAASLSDRVGVPTVDCLARAGPDRRQMGHDRSARLIGPGGSIVARAGAPARPLLVDDVVTTGATLAACARALRHAGAVEVTAVVFARTPGR
jgi:ComF family protein